MMGLSETTCPEDGATYELHQPDPGEPARLLLVCPACHRWHVVAETGRHPGTARWRTIAILFRAPRAAKALATVTTAPTPPKVPRGHSQRRGSPL